MSKHTKKPKTVPTFLQPNTVLSSRAAIFDDEYGLSDNTKVSKRSTVSRVSSKRNQEQHKQESESESEDDEAKAILERLYGQLQGAIEINESTDKIPDHTTMSSSTSDYEQLQAGQDEEEVDAMEFRLFASQDTPTAIVLAQTQPELVYVHRERPDLEESPGSVRMKQIADAAIDSATIMEQAKIPWTRTFFAHKVIDVPSKQRTCSGTTKKSKRKREWEKKVKAGLIDQATIDATARQVKVSESWGKPFLVRKGLDRNTIDTGVKQTTSGSSARGGRGGRGGAQRGRGASRGSRGGREGARGGLKSGTHMSRRGDRQDKAVNKSDGDDKSELSASTVPLKRSVNEHGVKDASKKRKVSDSSTAKQTSGNSSMSTSSGSKDKAMISGDRSSSTKITPQDSTSSSTPSKEKKATLPPKKPKASKPQSKLDNIMAILTGK